MAGERQYLEEFNRLLSQRIRENIPVQTAWAVCKSVNQAAGTMTATGQTDGLDYEDVLLGRGFLLLQPKVGSICLLGIIENNGALAYLVDAAEIDVLELKDKTGFTIRLQDGKMTLNGEGYSGIVKAPELKAQVDKNTAILQKIQEVFTNWAPMPNDGGAALKALAVQFTGMQRADLSGIENENIKHG